MSQSFPATVCVDGAVIRRTREEKQLTQLYVAKMVGVTTDTISRWENNRYPTIKRGNLLLLAEALEVPPGTLLRVEEELPGVSPQRRPRSFWSALTLLVLLALAGAFFYQRGQTPPVDLLAVRMIPNFAAPGSVIPIQIRLENQSQKGFILREHFPKGWKLVEASPPPSSLDNIEGMARWIIKPGTQQSLVAYRIQVAAATPLASKAQFLGELIANLEGRKVPVAVAGAESIRVERHHWADLDGDAIIDDGEVLEAFNIVEAMKDVHLDWEVLSAIWEAGGYRWDAQGRSFQPVRPGTDGR